MEIHSAIDDITFRFFLELRVTSARLAWHTLSTSGFFKSAPWTLKLELKLSSFR